MVLGIVLLTALLGTFSFEDAFDYPAEGIEGVPWALESISWKPGNGVLGFHGGDRAFAILEEAPYGKVMRLEATITVRERTQGEWAVAGLGFRWDKDNFWHLALAEGPKSKGSVHIVELAEMMEGRWLAHDDAGTRLPVIVHDTGNFQWEYNHPYRFRVVLTPEKIEGIVGELDGTPRAHIAHALEGRAVGAGQPMLHAGNFRAEFDEVSAAIETAADGPAAPVFPEYTRAAAETGAEARGYFYPVERDGRWWLADPNGAFFYMIGADHINYNVHWCEKLGYAPYARHVAAVYGSEAKWAETAAQRLSEWGFNTLAANHSPSLRHRAFPHIQFMSLGSSFARVDDICPITTWTGFPNVFSPDWPRHCDILARQMCAANRQDPWLIGYFSDNELEWFGKNYRPWGLFDETWKKSATHTAKQAWVEFLKERLSGPEEMGVLWGVEVSTYDGLAAHTEPGEPLTARAKTLAEEWVRILAERYFRSCREAVLRHDPNHLMLGCRFAGTAPAVWDIAGRYSDIVSFNIYPRIDVERGTPASVFEQINAWHEQAQKPMMCTEWSFPALDAGLPSVHGAGMRVDTQAQRAKCFTHFQSFLFRLPYMVGSNFFMWADEPALGISSTFPEDSNYGLVNERDEPYPELTRAARALHPRVYEIHARQEGFCPAPPRKLAAWLRGVPDRAGPDAGAVLRYNAGGLTIEGPADGHALRLSCGGTVLATLSGLIHQATSQPGWVPMDSGRVVETRENERVTTIDMEVTRTQGNAGGPGQPPAFRYRGMWRFWIPRGGGEWIAAQCLWVENTDAQAWTMKEAFHYLVPVLGGDAAHITALPADVPNYYVRGAAWVDARLNAGVGCWFAEEGEYACWFWKDPQGGFHPDLRVEVDLPLTPGQRHEINSPPVFFFPLHGATISALGQGVQHLESAVLEE